MKDIFSKLRFRRKEEEKKIETEELLEEESPSIVPRLTERAERLIKAKMRPIELYPLYQPWAYAHIVEDLNTGNLIYLVEEVTLNKREIEVYKEITDYITWELEPPKGNVDLHDYILSYARKALRLFQIRLGRTPGLSWSKIGYYIERDLLGYGKLDPIFRDENVEDISCNGPRKPVYVWHRKYESLPTNIVFNSEDELDEYVLKLAHMAGKHISVAYPILDAILPGGHRVAATFQKEVSTKGSTFTIRKFREDPITIVDLINYGTISSELAAYFWLAMDYKMTSLILGVTGAGKSVSGSTKVLAIVKGVPGIYKLNEIWEKIKDESIELAEGVEAVYFPDIMIRSCDPHTLECEWRKPTVFLRHKNDRRMLRVKLSSGRYVDVTEDHSLMILEDRKLKAAKPSQDIVGKRVLLPLNPIEHEGKMKVKQLLKVLKGDHLYVIIDNGAKKVISEAVRSLGRKRVLEVLGYRTLSLRTKGKIRLSGFRRLLGSVDEYPVDILVSSRKGTPTYLIKILSNPLFGEIMGYYVRRGSDNKSYLVIPVKDSRKAQRMCEAFGRECHVKKHVNDTASILVKGTLATLIRENAVGQQPGMKRIPPLYWVMPAEWKLGFLKGYIGSYEYMGRKDVELLTESEDLAWDIVFAFSELGITAELKSKNITGDQYYVISISKAFYEVMNSLETILPDESIRSSEDLKDDSSKQMEYGAVPGNLLESSFGVRMESLSPKAGTGSPSPWLHEGTPIARGVTLNMRGRNSSLISHPPHHNILQQNIGFDEIIAVEEIAPQEYVYDFEVADTQNFEANNIIVHNTSTLNALANLLRPTYKIVTIEDTPELRLPQENWVQLVSRPSYLAGGGVGEITLFHLVKVSLRYRPDVIVVGEVRGEEAYVLFQAIASVAGDTPILLRRRDGSLELVDIGDFVDTFYREGEERIAKPVTGYWALSHEGFNVVWKPVKYVLRHSTDEIYVIRYEGGVVKATGSHSVFVVDPSTLDIVEKPVRELRRGDLLITFKEGSRITESTVAKQAGRMFDGVKISLASTGLTSNVISPSSVKRLGMGHAAVVVRQLRDRVRSLRYVKGTGINDRRVPSAVVRRIIEGVPSIKGTKEYVEDHVFLPGSQVVKLLQGLSELSLPPKVEELTVKLLDFLEGPLKVVEVLDVRKEPFRGYVYDISVPGTESFFGGERPILLHNTGHSGMTTLHAESIDAAVKRLTSPPMNIPPAYMSLINFALVIKRLIMHKEGSKPRPVRRVTNVWEIRDYEDYSEVARWDPVRDAFELNVRDSLILRKISGMTGRGISELIDEISRRKAVLEWLATNNIRSYKEVARYVQKYYIDPQGVLKDIGAL